MYLSLNIEYLSPFRLFPTIPSDSAFPSAPTLEAASTDSDNLGFRLYCLFPSRS